MTGAGTDGAPGDDAAPAPDEYANGPGNEAEQVRAGAHGQQRAGGLVFDAVILAGGRGRRLGGRDKGALTVAGTPLLQRVLAACAGAERVIVAGQGPVPSGVHQVQEDPPGGGPVAGIVAGLELVRSPWVLLLAVDQPDAARAVPGLLAAAERAAERAEGGAARGTTRTGRAGADVQRDTASAERTDTGAGASAEAPGPTEESEQPGPAVELFCHVDTEGYPQWLLGLYRTSALRAAAARVGTGHGVSMRSLTADLTMSRVLDGAGHVGDVDACADHADWEARLR